jgi:hypothetical protein
VELPLSLRRPQLSLQYIVKLRSNPANPAFSCVINTGFGRLFAARPSVIATLSYRLQQNLLDCEINLNNIAKYSITQIPTWVLKAPQYQLTLSSLGSKSEVSPTMYEARLNELLSNYDGYTRIYLDGSKFGEAAGAAAALVPQVSNKGLPNHSSIFTAEARAILLALDMVQRGQQSLLLIVTDSLSCLQSMIK